MKRRFVLLLLLFCFFLAACSGSSTPSVSVSTSTNSQATTSSSATTSAAGPMVLHVTRTDPSATNNIGPLDKTVTDAQMVQNLYTMAIKLPAYPTGASISQSCLNDLGVIYHLDFLQGSITIQRMNLDPGNCKILSFSQTDLRQVSTAFLDLLSRALHVQSLTAHGDNGQLPQKYASLIFLGEREF